jgi:hypothetical protein
MVGLVPEQAFQCFRLRLHCDFYEKIRQVQPALPPDREPSPARSTFERTSNVE